MAPRPRPKTLHLVTHGTFVHSPVYLSLRKNPLRTEDHDNAPLTVQPPRQAPAAPRSPYISTLQLKPCESGSVRLVSIVHPIDLVLTPAEPTDRCQGTLGISLPRYTTITPPFTCTGVDLPPFPVALLIRGENKGDPTRYDYTRCSPTTTPEVIPGSRSLGATRKLI